MLDPGWVTAGVALVGLVGGYFRMEATGKANQEALERERSERIAAIDRERQERKEAIEQWIQSAQEMAGRVEKGLDSRFVKLSEEIARVRDDVRDVKGQMDQFLVETGKSQEQRRSHDDRLDRLERVAMRLPSA